MTSLSDSHPFIDRVNNPARTSRKSKSRDAFPKNVDKTGSENLSPWTNESTTLRKFSLVSYSSLDPVLLGIAKPSFWAAAPEGLMTYGTTEDKFSVSRISCLVETPYPFKHVRQAPRETSDRLSEAADRLGQTIQRLDIRQALRGFRQAFHRSSAPPGPLPHEQQISQTLQSLMVHRVPLTT